MKITYPFSQDGIIKMMMDDYLWARLGELKPHDEAIRDVWDGVHSTTPRPRYEWVAEGLIILGRGEWLEAVVADFLGNEPPKKDGDLDLAQIPEAKRIEMLAWMLT